MIAKQDVALDVLPDAWDSKGCPAVRARSGGWSSAAMILGVELCERLTTLGRYLTIAIFAAVQASRYRFKKLVGSPLTQIAAVVVAAWRKRKVELPADPALLYEGDGNEQKVEGEEDRSMRSKLKQKLPHTKQFRGLVVFGTGA